jgi:tetratricopeptide (TPR) repeat protein
MDPNTTAIGGQDPVRAALWRAWSAPDELRARVTRLQRAGLSAGIGSLDAPARALLLEPALGDPLQRAELAVQLAPELPAAHAALSLARFDRWDLLGAWAEMRKAADTALAHLEARLWLEATAHDALFGACLSGALGFLALAALAAFPRFARDLRRLRELPGPSSGALAVAVVLAPVALGEGLAGLGLGLLAFALVNGSAWRRLWVLSAGAALLVALFPLLERRAETRAALVLDPVAVAAWSTEQGTPGAVELARVVRAAESDPLAARAVALRLARQGELAEAERRFGQLLEQDPSPDLLANTAAVRLLRGDTEDAIALYERAARDSGSAVIRFNLAQAYGRAIRLDVQDIALREAQSLDPDVLSNLNHRYNGQDGALVAYLPLPVEPVLERLHGSAATAALARASRQAFAPGVVGESRGDAVVAFWLAAAAGLLLGFALRRFAGPEEDLYLGIARLLQTKGGDSNARMAQLQELRQRQRRVERAAGVVAWLVPGAAGMVANRPLLAWLSVAVVACAGSLWLHREGAVPDPLALGALPGALSVLALWALGLLYLVLLFAALALREKH